MVSEFSRFRVTPAYIWGTAVRKVFPHTQSRLFHCHLPARLGAGWSFWRNGVSDASLINYMVYIQCFFGSSFDDIKRRIAAVYDIFRVKSVEPEARTLHRWLCESDKFEIIDLPVLLSSDEHTINERSKKIQEVSRFEKNWTSRNKKNRSSLFFQNLLCFLKRRGSGYQLLHL